MLPEFPAGNFKRSLYGPPKFEKRIIKNMAPWCMYYIRRPMTNFALQQVVIDENSAWPIRQRVPPVPWWVFREMMK